jgi:hypothetical protein
MKLTLFPADFADAADLMPGICRHRRIGGKYSVTEGVKPKTNLKIKSVTLIPADFADSADLMPGISKGNPGSALSVSGVMSSMNFH